jgi:hypothetical protein
VVATCRMRGPWRPWSFASATFAPVNTSCASSLKHQRFDLVGGARKRREHQAAAIQVARAVRADIERRRGRASARGGAVNMSRRLVG